MSLRLLVIAGHDPSGGAGVDADTDAAHAFDTEVDAILTARTDQDDTEVRAVGAVPVREWYGEATRLLGVYDYAAIKIGLLPGAAHVRAAAALVARARSARPDMPVVVDPVIAASNGGRFLDEQAVQAIVIDLLPAGVVLTPNMDEADELARLDRGPRDDAARIEATRRLLARGAAGVVLTGGDGTEDPVRDLVAEPGVPPRWVVHARVPGAGIRGSGCRFATAVAARLGAGDPLPDAVHRAASFVASRIAV